jgi:hypothetical protein
MRTDSGYIYISGLQAWVLSSSVGHNIQYSSEWNHQILEYNGLRLQCCSYKGINSANVIHYVLASFIWSTAWFVGVAAITSSWPMLKHANG